MTVIFDADMAKTVRTMRSERQTIEAIARRVGVSRETLTAWMHVHGLSTLSPRRHPPDYGFAHAKRQAKTPER